MQFLSVTSVASLLALQGSLVAAGHHARHEALHALERRHRHHNREARASMAETSSFASPLFTAGAPITPAEPFNKRSFDDVSTLNRRGNVCQFPKDAGLVAVTPSSSNGGWAIPPDTQCKGPMFCPYACPSGQVMAQWDQSATAYTYPMSMNGGLKCNADGTVEKPFPNEPYCKDATGVAKAVDNTGKGVAWCQTQLPGDESMVIPTNCQGSADLAIPGTGYWLSTAAHYYINPPGVSTSDGCQWGSNQNPHGNWAPYVAGGNTVSSGETFLKLGWNPIYLEPATPFRNEMPNWGVEIKCDGAGCNGLPCAIDPTKNKVNEMVGGQGTGAGGANFCVVTVPKGVKASFVTFQSGQSSDNNGGNSGSKQSAAPSSAPAPTSSVAPSSSPAPSSSVASSSAVLTTSSAATSSSATSVSYSYAPHQLKVNVTSSAISSGASVALPTSAGAAAPPSQTSPIASAKASTGAAVANVVNGGLAAAVGAMALLAF